ncbi:MAG: DNA-binding protein [Alphaproteobacteria bacterium]|nr:MAG: DNA-binding protein [Alphaproteobacteria bacterium]
MSARRINPRLAKLHRAYSVIELAILLDVHRHTVRGWIKAGLPTVDRTRPVLIHGSEFQVWWGKRRKVAKRPLRPGQLYCFRCRQPKAPALGMVEYGATNAATGNLKALCETCGTMMHRSARLASIAAIMPNLDVRHREAPPSISGRTHPSPNYDNQTEG